ncbi:hypothetical protein GCM10009647_007700 [Streptomyces sanglieri]
MVGRSGIRKERDPSSGAFAGAEERSRSEGFASVSIGARAYPADLWTWESAQLSRFSLIFAALPRSSRR